MTLDPVQRQKHIRRLYHTLKSQLSIFEDGAPGVNINGKPVHYLEKTLKEFHANLPDVVPPFDKRDFFSHNAGKGDDYYVVSGVRAYLSAAIGALEVEVEEQKSTPVTEHRDFTFVADPEIRKIIERDYQEIQRAFVAGCWKSVIILSGGTIESILLDLVTKTPAALKSAKAPKGKSPDAWHLSHLIEVAVDVSGITPGVEKLSHSVREYRNLVHPGREIREKLSPSKEEATIALEVLHIVHRDLSV